MQVQLLVYHRESFVHLLLGVSDGGVLRELDDVVVVATSGLLERCVQVIAVVVQRERLDAVRPLVSQQALQLLLALLELLRGLYVLLHLSAVAFHDLSELRVHGWRQLCVERLDEHVVLLLLRCGLRGPCSLPTGLGRRCSRRRCAEWLDSPAWACQRDDGIAHAAQRRERRVR